MVFRSCSYSDGYSFLFLSEMVVMLMYKITAGIVTVSFVWILPQT
jgi:hypothetical protein